MSTLKLFIPVLGMLVVFGVAACSNDSNEPEPKNIESEMASAGVSPNASASANVGDNTITLVCPNPIGTVQATKDEADVWATIYVMEPALTFYPVAYGAIAFTDAETGQITVDGPMTKDGADTTGAMVCTFTDDVEKDGKTGTIGGTVTVVQQTLPSSQ